MDFAAVIVVFLAACSTAIVVVLYGISAVLATDSATVVDVFLAADCIGISDAEVAVVLVVVGSAKESAFCRLRSMRFKYLLNAAI